MRRRVLGGVIVLVLAAAGTAIYFLRYKTDTKVTPVDVDDAVAEFQEQQRDQTSSPPVREPGGTMQEPPPDETATTAETSVVDQLTVDTATDDTTVDTAAADVAAVLPEPGVYAYTTTGGDGVDALGGASHEYPELTTLIVLAEGCGVSQQWVAAEERSDQYLTCVTADGAGVAQQAFTEFHRFFGIDEHDEFLCTGDPRPLGAEAGTTWTLVCARSGEETTWAGTVLEPETLTVDGTEVATEHVVWELDNGDDRDSQHTETWYLAGSDLVVRRVITNETVEGSPIGDVTYTEDAELHLVSLTPSR